MGFHALILAVLCFLVSLLAQVYLQVNIVTAVFMGIWTAGIVICLQWVFLYYFRGYSLPGYAFYAPSSAQIFYTLLFFRWFIF